MNKKGPNLRIGFFLILFVISSLAYDKNFSYRKYEHVKGFIEPLVKQTVELGIKYDIPPAALLAIASVESGYGRGYVASITGNILSLGAGRKDKELPALYLPHTTKSYTVLYNQKIIKSYEKNQLVWKKRPKSLKKDYRPKNIAGTANLLDYFDDKKEEKLRANLENIRDFCQKWISLNNSHKVFQDARKYLNNEVKKRGKEILFSEDLNVKFIQSIGGKKNSFNYRTSWGKKVVKVLHKTGAVKLTKDIHEKKQFAQVW